MNLQIDFGDFKAIPWLTPTTGFQYHFGTKGVPLNVVTEVVNKSCGFFTLFDLENKDFIMHICITTG